MPGFELYLTEPSVKEFLHTYLTDISIIYANDPRFGADNVKKFGEDGLVIALHFSENPAFSNPTITKAFGQRLDENKENEYFCEAGGISWKCHEYRENFTGKESDDDDDVDIFSFFGWFSISQIDSDKEAKFEDDGLDKFGKLMVDDLWPSPMDWYVFDNENEDSSSDASFEEDDENDSEDEMM